jgi:GNAT superfamily N-acetyltransferase
VLGLHFVARRDGDADLAPPDGAFWVARRAGAPVGCVGARALDALTVELKRMYVAPAARGAGVARRLVAAAEDWARARGAATAVLDTRPELEAACRLYRATGWVEVAPYNDNDAAGLWFAKALGRPGGPTG